MSVYNLQAKLMKTSQLKPGDLDATSAILQHLKHFLMGSSEERKENKTKIILFQTEPGLFTYITKKLKSALVQFV